MEAFPLPNSKGPDLVSSPEKKTGRTEQIGSSHVRFTTDEYRHIKNDADVTGTSIPNLLKRAYFVGAPLVPLMRQDDKEMLMNQLSRIGNNLNQIARQLNSGFRAGFNEELSEIQKTFTRLVTFITSTYGSSKPQRER
jgi:Bacterial mobilisation protein (MobC)